MFYFRYIKTYILQYGFNEADEESESEPEPEPDLKNLVSQAMFKFD